MSQFTPPQNCPFAVVEAFLGSEKLYIAPISTNWLQDYNTQVGSKGNLMLKCAAFWPRNEDDVLDMMTKHVKPDPNDMAIWFPAEKDVTIFRFCATLGEAKAGIEDAECLSSVPTQLEIGKRSSKPNRKYVISSGSEEEERPPEKKLKPVAGKSKQLQKQAKHQPFAFNNLKINAAKAGASNGSSQTQSTSSSTPNASTIDLNGDGPGRVVPVPENIRRTSDPVVVEKPSNLSSAATKTTEEPSLTDNEEKEETQVDEPSHPPSPNLDDDENLSADLTTASSAAKPPAKHGTSNVVRKLYMPIDNNGTIEGKPATPSKRSPHVSFSPLKAKNKLYYSPLAKRQGAASSAEVVTSHDILSGKLDDIIARTNSIYLAVCPGAAMAACGDKSELPTLPIDSKEQLVEVEKFVSVEEQKLSLIATLATSEGTQLRDIVYAVMRKLFTNQMASKFNLEGRNRNSDGENKEGFKSLALYHVVHAAVVRKANKMKRRAKEAESIYNSKLVDTDISLWLSNAPKRAKNDENRKQKRARE